MFFGFQLTLGLMMAFYGFSVMKIPRVGRSGRRAVKAENFEEYCRQNGQFFLKAGCVVAVIGALDALITLDALLYALLYIFGLAFASTPLPAGASRTKAFPGHGPTSRARKSASRNCAANSRHRRTRKKGRSDPPG